VHVRPRDLTDAMAGHPKPDESDETRKRALPGVPTIGVLKPPASEFCGLRI
jgi:hypothetical protein